MNKTTAGKVWQCKESPYVHPLCNR